MDYQNIWNYKGGPYQILMLGPEKELAPYIEWFSKRGLKQQRQNYFEGKVRLNPKKPRQYVMQLTTVEPEEFEKIPTSELKYDCVMIYLPRANLTKPAVLEPYDGWEEWGGGQVRKLMFIDASICPSEYYTMSLDGGDWVIISAMEGLFGNLATDPKPAPKPLTKDDEFYYI